MRHPAAHEFIDQSLDRRESARLEPGVVSVKFYAPHVGIISEHDMSGGNETFELVSAHR